MKYAIRTVLAAAVVMAAVSSCTAARVAEPETLAETYPADWTANPTAGVVYEPIPESGANHE